MEGATRFAWPMKAAKAATRTLVAEIATLGAAQPVWRASPLLKIYWSRVGSALAGATVEIRAI